MELVQGDGAAEAYTPPPPDSTLIIEREKIKRGMGGDKKGRRWRKIERGEALPRRQPCLRVKPLLVT